GELTAAEASAASLQASLALVEADAEASEQNAANAQSTLEAALERQQAATMEAEGNLQEAKAVIAAATFTAESAAQSAEAAAATAEKQFLETLAAEEAKTQEAQAEANATQVAFDKAEHAAAESSEACRAELEARLCSLAESIAEASTWRQAAEEKARTLQEALDEALREGVTSLEANAEASVASSEAMRSQAQESQEALLATCRELEEAQGELTAAEASAASLQASLALVEADAEASEQNAANALSTLEAALERQQAATMEAEGNLQEAKAVIAAATFTAESAAQSAEAAAATAEKQFLETLAAEEAKTQEAQAEANATQVAFDKAEHAAAESSEACRAELEARLCSLAESIAEASTWRQAAEEKARTLQEALDEALREGADLKNAVRQERELHDAAMRLLDEHREEGNVQTSEVQQELNNLGGQLEQKEDDIMEIQFDMVQLRSQFADQAKLFAESAKELEEGRSELAQKDDRLQRAMKRQEELVSQMNEATTKLQEKVSNLSQDLDGSRCGYRALEEHTRAVIHRLEADRQALTEELARTQAACARSQAEQAEAERRAERAEAAAATAAEAAAAANEALEAGQDVSARAAADAQAAGLAALEHAKHVCLEESEAYEAEACSSRQELTVTREEVTEARLQTAIEEHSKTLASEAAAGAAQQAEDLRVELEAAKQELAAELAAAASLSESHSQEQHECRTTADRALHELHQASLTVQSEMAAKLVSMETAEAARAELEVQKGEAAASAAETQHELHQAVLTIQSEMAAKLVSMETAEAARAELEVQKGEAVASAAETQHELHQVALTVQSEMAAKLVSMETAEAAKAELEVQKGEAAASAVETQHELHQAALTVQSEMAAKLVSMETAEAARAELEVQRGEAAASAAETQHELHQAALTVQSEMATKLVSMETAEAARAELEVHMAEAAASVAEIQHELHQAALIGQSETAAKLVKMETAEAQEQANAETNAAQLAEAYARVEGQAATASAKPRGLQHKASLQSVAELSAQLSEQAAGARNSEELLETALCSAEEEKAKCLDRSAREAEEAVARHQHLEVALTGAKAELQEATQKHEAEVERLQQDHSNAAEERMQLAGRLSQGELAAADAAEATEQHRRELVTSASEMRQVEQDLRQKCEDAAAEATRRAEERSRMELLIGDREAALQKMDAEIVELRGTVDWHQATMARLETALKDEEAARRQGAEELAEVAHKGEVKHEHLARECELLSSNLEQQQVKFAAEMEDQADAAFKSLEEMHASHAKASKFEGRLAETDSALTSAEHDLQAAVAARDLDSQRSSELREALSADLVRLQAAELRSAEDDCAVRLELSALMEAAAADKYQLEHQLESLECRLEDASLAREDLKTQLKSEHDNFTKQLNEHQIELDAKGALLVEEVAKRAQESEAFRELVELEETLQKRLSMSAEENTAAEQKAEMMSCSLHTEFDAICREHSIAAEVHSAYEQNAEESAAVLGASVRTAEGALACSREELAITEQSFESTLACAQAKLQAAETTSDHQESALALFRAGEVASQHRAEDEQRAFSACEHKVEEAEQELADAVHRVMASNAACVKYQEEASTMKTKLDAEEAAAATSSKRLALEASEVAGHVAVLQEELAESLRRSDSAATKQDRLRAAGEESLRQEVGVGESRAEDAESRSRDLQAALDRSRLLERHSRERIQELRTQVALLREFGRDEFMQFQPEPRVPETTSENPARDAEDSCAACAQVAAASIAQAQPAMDTRTDSPDGAAMSTVLIAVELDLGFATATLSVSPWQSRSDFDGVVQEFLKSHRVRPVFAEALVKYLQVVEDEAVSFPVVVKAELADLYSQYG
ncbi:unnamed protein product, partial [Polarella glacialis]